jgi:hypothetical protein
MSDSDAAPARGETRRLHRWGPVAALALVLAGVFAPVWLHCGEMIYNPRSDLLAFTHPYRVLQSQAWEMIGRPTLWDPTSFGGRPVLGDPQAGLFYPPNWLSWLADGEAALAAGYGWSVLLHLLIGGLGVLYWLRGAGLSAPARIVAALVFALYGKWFHHLLVQGHLVFLPLMWLPWQCALVERIWREPSRRGVAALAGVSALVAVGAHPQPAFYGQLLVALYALGFGFAHGRWRSAPPWLAFAAAGALALGLSAVFLLPIAADAGLYVRGAGLDYATAAARAVTFADLGELLWPTGPPRVLEPPPYAGVLALPLGAFALLRAPRSVRVLCSVIAIVLIAWYGLGEVGGLHRWLYAWVPGFDLFRLPSRVFLVAGLPLALLSGYGLDALSGGEGLARKRVLAAGLLACAGIGVAATILRGGTIAWLPALAWSLPALVLAPWPRRCQAGIVAGVALLLALDLARIAAPLVETRPLADVLGDNPVARRIAAPLGEGRVLAFNFRSRGDLSALPASYTTRAGLESVRGFNPMAPRATVDFLIRGAANAEPEIRPRVTIPSFAIESRPHLDLFNVRWLVTNAPQRLPGLELRERFGPFDVFHYQLGSDHTTLRETFLYENTERMPRAALVREARLVDGRTEAIEAVRSLDARSVVLVEEAELVGVFPGVFRALPVEHRMDELFIEVDAGQGGYLVLSELDHPGWRALDGRQPLPIHRANGVFQVVRLSPGEHALHFAYRPRAFLLGAGITLLSLALTVACALPRRGSGASAMA